MKTVLSLIGARPQFIKEALVGALARNTGAWRHMVVHSGQHYDANMSDVFFDDLHMPAPDYNLGIGSGSHAAQTAAALLGMERVLHEVRPHALIVYGDTNTTLAGALAAAKLHIPVVHVEAGIRMLPKTMPEEINRTLTDHCSSVFCCCSAHEVATLAAEGITHHVALTGDVMCDVFMRMLPHVDAAAACAAHDLSPGSFAVVTLHRDYNVDEREPLENILRGLGTLASSGVPVLFFIHPRTQKRVAEFGLHELLAPLRCSAPVGYKELMSLVCGCAFVVTDSGGLQKEAYYAGKRAVVLMPDTGWRALTDCGWNTLATPVAHRLLEAVEHIRAPHAAAHAHLYGDGQAAPRIIRAVRDFLEI